MFGLKSNLLAASSVLALSVALPALAQEPCDLVNGALPDHCNADSAGLAVAMENGANTELDEGVSNTDEGFLISIDGQPVSGDLRVEDIMRKADKALAKADVQVQYDGLGAKPRLDAEIVDVRPIYRAGDRVTVQSRMNYPAFVTRGEVRVIDLEAQGGPYTVLTVPVDANGQTSFTMPEGGYVVFVHRVYDERGRYDETAPIPLSQTIDRGQKDGIEEGSDATSTRRIPVYGGAVTVSGTDVRSGATVRTLGETVTLDANGGFVIQRILPAGDQAVEVVVAGNGENVVIEREFNIPKSDWFYVATADLTFGKRLGDLQPGQSEYYDYGRLAGYAKGKTASGWTITASADTREDDLSDIFRNFDEKDPRGLLLRLDSDEAYPVYGDDSTIEEDAPTNGKFYLKAERDGNHVMWGNYQSTISGSHFLRNERTLYGAQGRYASAKQTSSGEAVFSFEAYASQPDNLPVRDVFRGTGGSIYFLSEQDLSIGSETLSVEIRDADTGRVIETRALVYGRDYEINYIQGIITLAQPLTSSAYSGTVVTDPSGDVEINLVAQYEYTPVAGDIDGYSYGARVEAWATDQLRFGATGLVEQTGGADQKAYGVDVRYQHSERTWVDLEYARTEGPGFASNVSDDGGLVIRSTTAASGTGDAYLVRGQADLREVGLNVDGTFAAYAERRSEGFSTLDYNTATTENLWGVSLDVKPSEHLTWGLYYDDFEDATGKSVREGGVELSYQQSDRLTWNVGVEHLAKNTPTGAAEDNGSRTDLAIRANWTQSDDLSYYAYAQSTVDRSGGFERNNRIGVGIETAIGQNWRFAGEVSGGSQGTGAKALFNYNDGDADSYYFGYTLLPDREFDGSKVNGRDRGQFVAGGKRKINDNVQLFADNTYDLFGNRRSLISAYGVEYRHSDYITYFGSVDVGRIKDSDDNTDFDRNALTFGMRYKDEDGLTAKAQLEYREDSGTENGNPKDTETLAFTTTLRYEIDEEQRLLFHGEYTDTDAVGNSIAQGQYAEATLGYAYRPIDNDRLNVLFKYTYLYDMYGQDVDGTDPGDVQESHVLSLDASYDINEHWTLGGKIGGRWGRSAPNRDTPLQHNDAYLAVLNARYHLTHEWDVLLEGRYLKAEDAGTMDIGFLGAVYRHIGNNVKVGVGYNFGDFSDDLTDLTYDDKGVFVNLIAKF